jgi:hypothetical protein
MIVVPAPRIAATTAAATAAIMSTTAWAKRTAKSLRCA